MNENENIIKKRDTNFELLRIVAMIMIVILHFNNFGKMLSNVELGSKKYYIVYFLEYACIIAVNLYVMITGFYMIKSKPKIKKLIGLELEVIFYSVGVYLILILLNKANFNIKILINSIFPVITKQYWFITAYVGLYLLIPFINKLVENLDKKDFKIMLILLTILMSILKTLYSYNTVFEANNGYGLAWFIYLYLLAGYIRLYYDRKIKKLYLFLGYIAIIIIQIILTTISKKCNNAIAINYLNISLSYNSFFILIESVLFFLLFKGINIKNNLLNKLILCVSPLTLSVYLIHENNAIRDLLWTGWLHPFTYLNDGFKLSIALVVDTILIFTICCIIDKIRVILFDFIAKCNLVKKSERYLEKLNKNI